MVDENENTTQTTAEPHEAITKHIGDLVHNLVGEIKAEFHKTISAPGEIAAPFRNKLSITLKIKEISNGYKVESEGDRKGKYFFDEHGFSNFEDAKAFALSFVNELVKEE